MDILAEQKRYYEARAHDYDEWWERRGRYDRGAEGNKAWRGEIENITGHLDEFALSGRVLELAGGSGYWSAYLARRAHELTVLDASAAMLELNQQRLRRGGLLEKVVHQRVDLFNWSPSDSYDAVFAAFWICHVPVDRLDAHLSVIASALAPGGRFIMLASMPGRSLGQGTSWIDDEIQQRTLNDGSTFQVVKREIHVADMAARLQRAGFEDVKSRTNKEFQFLVATKR